MKMENLVPLWLKQSAMQPSPEGMDVDAPKEGNEEEEPLFLQDSDSRNPAEAARASDLHKQTLMMLNLPLLQSPHMQKLLSNLSAGLKVSLFLYSFG